MTYTELTGARRSMGGVMTSDCAPHAFTRGVASSVRPFKSWAASRDDPTYDFYLAWGTDPDLHLPTGRWRIDVLVSGYLAPCEMNAPGVSLTIPIELTIR